MKRIVGYLLSFAVVSGLGACQSDVLSQLGVGDAADLFESSGLLDGKGAAKQDKMVVKDVVFSPDHKTFSLWTSVVDDIGPYSLTDSSSVRIEVEEYDDGVKMSRHICPTLVKAWNTESDQIAELGFKALVLVDLSLSQEQIDAEQRAVGEMATVLNRNNLFIAFMAGSSVSKTQPVTDYILQTYFKKASTKKYLYRSVAAKLREMAEGKEIWADTDGLSLIVFSDGNVYDENNVPFDPDHFKMAGQLLKMDLPDSLRVCSVHFGKGLDGGEDADATDVLKSLCTATGGAYLPQFSWVRLESNMLGPRGEAITSNRFDFVNPDRKVYRGDNNQLKLLFYSVKDNHLVASATASIREGSLYKPIIVNGDSLGEILLAGISVGLVIILLLYFILQFLVPFIRYRLFLRKHVVRYTGGSMVMGDTAVAESCYLCKEPFKEGDEIVVKCAHTMHKSCWDENEYHCPEFGRHCKEGSHFYNREHLFDKRNAPYYMKWLLMGVLVSVCAWAVLSVWTNYTSKHVLEYLMPVEHLAADENGTHLNQLPSYGFFVGFFLTLGIALMAIRRKRVLTWLGAFFRALLAGTVSALLYLLISVTCIALHLESVSFILNLIPWVLSGFLIAWIGTYGSGISLKKNVFFIALGVSLVSMYLWYSCYLLIGVDFRVLLLFSIMIYAVGIVLSVASAAPKSEHYFLEVKGAVKTMDVALYKWFRANPNAVVSIGKSVDCSLQLTWDLQSHVAPVHAEITLKRGELRLMALEEGVTLGGRPLKVDKYKRLCHGTSFQIGRTIFTYQEKDI